MKSVVVFQTLLTLIGSLASYAFVAKHQVLSFSIGSIVILTSFILMGISFGWIFKKKLVALAIGIIVFKYAILGIIMFTLVKLSWFNPLWFAMGVASFVLSGIFYALKEALREGKENVI